MIDIKEQTWLLDESGWQKENSAVWATFQPMGGRRRMAVSEIVLKTAENGGSGKSSWRFHA